MAAKYNSSRINLVFTERANIYSRNSTFFQKLLKRKQNHCTEPLKHCTQTGKISLNLKFELNGDRCFIVSSNPIRAR